MHGNLAQPDQAGAVLAGVEGDVEGLVGDGDPGRDVGADRIRLGADDEGSIGADQESADEELGVDVRPEGERGAGVDRDGL